MQQRGDIGAKALWSPGSLEVEVPRKSGCIWQRKAERRSGGGPSLESSSALEGPIGGPDQADEGGAFAAVGGGQG